VWGLLKESRGLLEFPRLLLEFPDLSRQPKGRGEPVLVLPGYGASEASTFVLQQYLKSLGYRAEGWGLGRNDGRVPKLVPRVIRRLEQVARKTKQPVRFVGWSLGGYLAREAARDRPELVDQVITLGTPTVGGPKYTVIADAYRRRGVDLDKLEEAVAARNENPLTVPVTAIYSRSDRVVAWQACVDHHSPNVDHVEVNTTHLGLGFAPEVYRIIAKRLARTSVERTSRPT
jgi:pimeloyl-ACP methyl ester carboxylesterase